MVSPKWAGSKKKRKAQDGKEVLAAQLICRETSLQWCGAAIAPKTAQKVTIKESEADGGYVRIALHKPYSSIFTSYSALM